ncbi:MAG TPA: hypothetical protein VGF49_11315 [Candidatus Solibacter sp.]
MSNESTFEYEPECAVCYAVHDAEIHEATLRVHRWFCGQVTHEFEEDATFAPVLASHEALH